MSGVQYTVKYPSGEVDVIVCTLKRALEQAVVISKETNHPMHIFTSTESKTVDYHTHTVTVEKHH